MILKYLIKITLYCGICYCSSLWNGKNNKITFCCDLLSISSLKVFATGCKPLKLIRENVRPALDMQSESRPLLTPYNRNPMSLATEKVRARVPASWMPR
jgi:hypothetical protein